MVSIDEFRNYLAFDKFALDDALREQPSLLFAVSDAYEVALAERDTLKDAINTIEADLDAEIRDAYEEAKAKVTEPQIKHLIARDPKRRKAYDAYAIARAKAGRLNALKEAFKERGYNVRQMCELYTSNYFEQASSRPTPHTERVVSNANRQRLANARTQRGGSNG